MKRFVNVSGWLVVALYLIVATAVIVIVIGPWSFARTNSGNLVIGDFTDKSYAGDYRTLTDDWWVIDTRVNGKFEIFEVHDELLDFRAYSSQKAFERFVSFYVYESIARCMRSIEMWEIRDGIPELQECTIMRLNERLEIHGIRVVEIELEPYKAEFLE